MAEKMTCPACDSHTSGVLAAYRDGEPCPYCDLPADIASEVLAARQRGGEAYLTRLYEQAVIRAGRAEAERDALRQTLDAVEQALKGQD